MPLQFCSDLITPLDMNKSNNWCSNFCLLSEKFSKVQKVVKYSKKNILIIFKWPEAEGCLQWNAVYCGLLLPTHLCTVQLTAHWEYMWAPVSTVQCTQGIHGHCTAALHTGTGTGCGPAYRRYRCAVCSSVVLRPSHSEHLTRRTPVMLPTHTLALTRQ